MASSVALALPSTQLSENVERCYNGGTVKEHRGASLDVTTSQKKKKKNQDNLNGSLVAQTP